MKRKATLFIWGAVLAGVAAFALFVQFRNGGLLPENNMWNRESPASPAQAEESVAPDEFFDDAVPKITGDPTRDALLQKREGNTTVLGQPIETDGLRITANGQSVSKQPSMPLEHYKDLILETDADGNIINEYSYYTISVTMENLREEEREVCMKSFELRYFVQPDGDLLFIDGAEAFGFDARPMTTKDAFFYTLAPGESKEFRVVFYVLDADIARRDTAVLVYNPGGGYPISDYVRFFDLKDG